MNENEQDAQRKRDEKRGDEQFDEEPWQPRLWSKIILLIVIVGYGIALVVANSDEVDISFLIASIEVSKIWLILLCFVIGLVSGVLMSQMYRHRKIQRTRLRQLEAEKKSSSGSGAVAR